MDVFRTARGRPPNRWQSLDKAFEQDGPEGYERPVRPQGLVKLAILGLAPVFLIVWPLQISVEWVFGLISATYEPSPTLVSSLELAVKAVILVSVLYASFLAYLSWWYDLDPVKKAGMLLFWSGAAYLITAMNFAASTLMETTVFQEEPLIAADLQNVAMVAFIPLGGLALAALFNVVMRTTEEILVVGRRARSRAAITAISRHTPSTVGQRKRAA